MTLRTQEERDTLSAAAAIKRRESKERRKARKEAAREHVKAWAKSTVAKPKDVRERNKPFLSFLRRQPCAAAHLGGCSGPIEAAHVRYSSAKHGVRNPGMQARNHDRHCNPLCHHHHQSDQHKRRERDFWAEVGVDAYDNAASLYAAFLAGDERPFQSPDARSAD